MAIDDLSLDVGDVLQLQYLPDESQGRHYVKVIGYMHDRSLIVTTPHVNGKVMLIREGQRFAVRLLSGNAIMAFTVSVLRSCGRPYPYLHLSYPKELQAITVRKAQRVNFHTNATVKACKPTDGGSDAVSVVLEDLSTTGALIIAPSALVEVKDLLSVSMCLEVAGQAEDLDLICVVRNVRQRESSDDKKQYLHGVEFKFADRQESIMLHAFVYEQIVNSHD